MRKILYSALAAILLPAPFAAVAQQAVKVWRIGWLTASRINADFRERMSELGYVEGKNIAFEFRQAKRRERYPALARELVAGKRLELLKELFPKLSRVAHIYPGTGRGS